MFVELAASAFLLSLIMFYFASCDAVVREQSTEEAHLIPDQNVIPIESDTIKMRMFTDRRSITRRLAKQSFATA
jgi:hypothetical protein